ncbi:hypothetical protein A5756_18610 [Mycobacterium sp. 852002-53434_SCH5985345]|nr:PE family protein [Mycobacterium sp. 852002-53434_SCH5985345]OBF51835.1 hypothetical protein A5756_18610 [Mycobacterium sp. 852002-53434_SCH5985345]
MSFVTTQPDLLLAAAGQLQAIGSAVTAANSMAAFSITGVVPAAADEVSAMTAAAFAGYGQQYQAISAQASMIHEQFVSALGRSADSYAATEAANRTQMVGGHVAPARMAPVAPARPAPAAPAHVSPPAPRRVTPNAPGRAVPGAPVGSGPAAPGPLGAATPVGAGWQGGGGYGAGNYGAHPAPQHGGYANANYGHMTRQHGGYANANYGAHPAPQHGGYANANYGAHPAPAGHVAGAELAAGQHISPSQLAPTAPVHRMPLAAAAIPAEHVAPMHLPAGMPNEHVVQAHAALKAAGPKPMPALA